ncbi:hypothetical protein BDN70DRAFT_964529 [Pholiota conissans]|uniref:Pali-domain-containing protein n=1 Tax=Pholiota conissans TaxID=109636 RepID=A0A9P5ZGN3_9AGAR|nr:hypothetical protein BDN70DRAFT_964529 [Pholiota conissans]
MESRNDYKVDVHRPQMRYRIVTVLSVGLLFSSFLLLLLVSLSLPIIKPIYLLSVQSTTPVASQLRSLDTELRFGVWGVCATSTLDPAIATSNPGLCFGPMLGYQVPDDLAAIVNIPPTVVSVVENTLIVVLVLHPIAAGLSSVALVLSIFFTSHGFSILILIVTILTALVSSVALAIDLALVIVAKNSLAKLDSLEFAITFGNGVWMILGAVIATWFAVLTLSMKACYCLGRFVVDILYMRLVSLTDLLREDITTITTIIHQNNTS